MTMIPSGHKSEGASVDEIGSLTLRIKDLSHSVDFWNELMLWGLALAAIAAVFVVVATRIVVSQTGKLSEAQDLLSAAKDRVAAKDSKDKDGNISLANKAAGDANERAAKLEVEAGKLRLQLSAQERRSNVLLQPQIRARFGSRVKPFAGQYFDVLTCRIHESETTYFSMSIWGTLSGDLANCNIGKLEDVPSCTAGLMVMVEPDAPA